MIYQILGWPRSRTAWLANFLTYNSSFCFHEGVALKNEKRLRNLKEYKNLFNLYTQKYDYVGDANTIGLFKQKYVLPKAKVVIIERDKQDIEESVFDLGYRIEIPEIIEYPYNEYISIKYEEINDNLHDIWQFCLPGVSYPKEREILLKDLNIQVNNVHEYVMYKLDV